MKATLKSKKFWIGFIGGTIAGGWAFNKLADVTGVGVKLPTLGS